MAARAVPAGLRARFLAVFGSGGSLLMIAAGLGLVAANSPLAPFYFDALHAEVAGMSLHHWLNDGLMTLFFLLVGLEIRRELVEGGLATWPRRVLPGLAAAGGMLVPALVYVGFTHADPVAVHGWAIASATDIAFALGILALLGPRVPAGLKVFLTALAILDDLGAVVIIGVFYTQQLDVGMLGGAALVLAALAVLNRLRVGRVSAYVLLGIVLWVFVLKSGVHATVTGVLLAAMMPMRVRDAAGGEREVAAPVMHRLQPWVALLVVPLFGFANAGVSFQRVAVEDLAHPVVLGVMLGLFLGKQAGVFGSVWLAVRLGLARLPDGMGWAQLYGVSLLCGIGFTMSLFIGLLAFPSAPHLQELMKVGILAGSGLSAGLGLLVLWWVLPGRGDGAPHSQVAGRISAVRRTK